MQSAEERAPFPFHSNTDTHADGRRVEAGVGRKRAGGIRRGKMPRWQAREGVGGVHRSEEGVRRGGGCIDPNPRSGTDAICQNQIKSSQCHLPHKKIRSNAGSIRQDGPTRGSRRSSGAPGQASSYKSGQSHLPDPQKLKKAHVTR